MYTPVTIEGIATGFSFDQCFVTWNSIPCGVRSSFVSVSQDVYAHSRDWHTWIFAATSKLTRMRVS